MSPEDFTKHVITMNEECLNENTLEQTLNNMPAPEDLKKLKDLAAKTPLEEFHNAEKFAIAVSLKFLEIFY